MDMTYYYLLYFFYMICLCDPESQPFLTLLFFFMAVPVSVLKPTEDIQETFEIGETVHLMIEAEGSPEPTFEWTHNGQPCPGAVSRIFEIRNFRLVIDLEDEYS